MYKYFILLFNYLFAFFPLLTYIEFLNEFTKCLF